LVAPIAYREKVDEATAVLAWIRARLDEEEREHLALELLDATRREGGFEGVLSPWALTVVAREHLDYPMQLKEWRNLDSSGELFAGTPLADAADPFLPRA
jgi:hypothetical protein